MKPEAQTTQSPTNQIGQTSDPVPQPGANNMIGLLPRQQEGNYPQPTAGNQIGLLPSQYGDDVED